MMVTPTQDQKQSIKTFDVGDFRVTLTETLEAAERDWRALEESALITVYQCYDWQNAWFDTIGRETGAIAFILTARLKDELAFVIPLAITRHRGIIRAQWMGEPHANYCMGLFNPEMQASMETSLPAILDMAARTASAKIDVFDLTQQPFTWDGARNPMAALPHHPSVNSGASVSLAGDFDEVLSRGNAKRKRKILRRQERDLKAFGGYRLRSTKTAAEGKEVLRTFLAQKAPWFEERGIKNTFAGKATLDFFDRLLERSGSRAERALLTFDYIESCGDILAILGCGIHRGEMFGYFTSINKNPDYAPISPGALNFYKSIEAACENGIRTYDFGIGGERYKDSWCDQDHPLFDVLLPTSAKGRLVVALERLKTAAKRNIKQNDALWHFVKTQRKRFSKA